MPSACALKIGPALAQIVGHRRGYLGSSLRDRHWRQIYARQPASARAHECLEDHAATQTVRHARLHHLSGMQMTHQTPQRSCQTSVGIVITAVVLASNAQA